MKHIKLFKMYGWKCIARAFSDKACKEFHITPVLTYSWTGTANEYNHIAYGYGLALEWGWWAAYVFIFKTKKKK